MSMGLTMVAFWTFVAVSAYGVPWSPPYLNCLLLVAGEVGTGAAFVIGCLFLRRSQPRWLLVGVWIIGAVCRLMLLPAPPIWDNDSNRYLWDGAVWRSGYNPWRYSPHAALAGTAPGLPDGLHRMAITHAQLIAHINHAGLPTIYPPVSEAIFAAAALICPFSMIALKGLLLLFDTGTAIMVALSLRQLQLPAVWVLIYWLNPVVINAFANEAHLDSVTLFFVAAFTFLLLCNRPWSAGAALGLAIGAKFWPVVLGAVLYRHYWSEPYRLAGAMLATALAAGIALSPMMITGPPAFTSLSAYVHYWQANDLVFHGVFLFWSCLLWRWAAAQSAAWGTAIIILGGMALWLLRRCLVGKALVRTSLLLIATLFILSPIEFPWYYTWLLPMLAICPRLSLLLWSCTLGLYHWAYLATWVVWVEHAPVIGLLILEAFIPTLRGFFWESGVVERLTDAGQAPGPSRSIT